MKLFFASLSVVCSLRAASFYASPSGTPGNAGTIGSPWDLATALNHASVQPGDTVWLRGGTYQAVTGSLIGFRYTVAGTIAAPITVRNYNGERATIDARGSRLLMRGDPPAANIRFWGLEFIDSLKGTNAYGYTAAFSGPDADCNDVRIINCIIHDGGTAAGGGPYVGYGNVIYYSGRSLSEHGFYWQNDYKTTGCKKYIQDNIIASVAGYGIHSYSVSGQLNGYVIEGNAIWNSGSIGPEWAPAILLGGGQPVDVAEIRNNHVYAPAGPWTTGVQLGYATIGNLNAVVTDNRIAAKWPFIVDESFQTLTWTGNAAHAYSLNVVSRPVLDQGPYAVDANTYTNVSGENAFELGTVVMGFSEWRTATRFDLTSTMSQAPNAHPPDAVFVRPNTYEPGRGHIIVHNWSRANSVKVSLLSILKPGDSYVVRAAQNYYGPAVASGRLGRKKSAGIITLPMTGISLATPISFPGINPPISSFPEFGVFVVQRMAP